MLTIVVQKLGETTPFFVEFIWCMVRWWQLQQQVDCVKPAFVTRCQFLSSRAANWAAAEFLKVTLI